MLQPSAHSGLSDFARAISSKFEQGRFLVIGADPASLERAFAEAGRKASVCAAKDLQQKLQRDPAARFDIAIWFYPGQNNDDASMSEVLSRYTTDIVLMPGTGVDPAERRPQLIESFRRLGLLPDYGFDLDEVRSGAIRLRHSSDAAEKALLRGVETALAELNKRMGAMQRTLEMRRTESEAADRHIASLEEKLVKLEQYRRELKLLKEERCALRKAPERRVGQVLLAPYRIPERLLKATWKRIRGVGRGEIGRTYEAWLARHRPRATEFEQMRSESQEFTLKPLLSVITPVFDTPVRRLEEAVESVIAQAYDNWEMILVDDGSSTPDLLKALPSLAARDQRIVLTKLETHQGISQASNRGLELARGEWIALLDHDDVLEPDALFQIVKLLQIHPDADLIFSDEDKLVQNGFEAPLFKPDWSPDFFLSYNYIGHLTAMRREIVQEAGRFRSEFDGAQDYDLFLRIIERTNRIYHVPRVLYHWRRSEDSSAAHIRQKPGQLEAGRFAIEDHLRRRNERAHVMVDWRTHAFHVRRELTEAKKISIIIAAGDNKDWHASCLDAFANATRYPNYEIVVLKGEIESPGAAVPISHVPHRVLPVSDMSNNVARNFAAKQVQSPWLLFLDDAVEPILQSADWLTIMAEHVRRAEVGAVGARLLNRDETIEHAGTVIGINGIAQPAFRGFPAEHLGVSRQLQITRNCTAVSGACMLIRREIFEEMDGFDETLPESVADVDLCLKIRQAGYLIVYTPFAKLYWERSSGSSIDGAAETIMRQRWGEVLQRDPYYNPNLSRQCADFSLAK